MMFCMYDVFVCFLVMDWHNTIKVKATKVISGGRKQQVVIELSDQRLHASGVFGNVYQARLGGSSPRQVAIKKTGPSKITEVLYCTTLLSFS